MLIFKGIFFKFCIHKQKCRNLRIEIFGIVGINNQIAQCEKSGLIVVIRETPQPSDIVRRLRCRLTCVRDLRR